MNANQDDDDDNDNEGGPGGGSWMAVQNGGGTGSSGEVQGEDDGTLRFNSWDMFPAVFGIFDYNRMINNNLVYYGFRTQFGRGLSLGRPSKLLFNTGVKFAPKSFIKGSWVFKSFRKFLK